jgi:predicted MFS family arabinose efflux permease
MLHKSLYLLTGLLRFISTFGNVFASSLAKRLGLIQAMVATHLPSSIFLGLLPAASDLPLTIVLLIGRSMLSSMDQAPRSTFIAQVVLPEERTAVMGVVNILKTLSQSAGPLVTGLLAGRDHFWVAFVVAGSVKAAYDIMLLAFFGGQVHQPKDHDNNGYDEAAADNDVTISCASERMDESPAQLPEEIAGHRI